MSAQPVNEVAVEGVLSDDACSSRNEQMGVVSINADKRDRDTLLTPLATSEEQRREEERRSFAQFAVHYSLEEYQGPMGWAYDSWWRFNHELFEDRLRQPHFFFMTTPGRRLGHCRATTGHGAELEILFNEGLVLNYNPEWIVNPGGGGHQRFNEDLLLRFAVRQWVIETEDDAEPRSYKGVGPRFAKKATSVGIVLGLPPVVARRRPTDQDRPFVAPGWPHNARGRLYYGRDISENLFNLAAGMPTEVRPAAASSAPGLLELLQYLLALGRVDQAREMIARRLAWLEMLQSARWPVRPEVEAGNEDTDGKALGTVTFDPAWLLWNGGTARRITESIRAGRTYGDLPILADALEEAGCGDGRILLHLRERMQHSNRCWAMRLLLALDQK